MTPALTRRSAASWAAPPGVAMTPIETPLARTIGGEVVELAHAHAADHRADLGGVDVDDAGDREATLAEAAVAGEGLAEVAGADDDDGPVVGEAELTADLVDEVLDLVADAAGAVGAEVAEVLADLGGVDAGEIGELLGRHVRRAGVGLLEEDPQVHRQPGDGGLRDPPATAGRRHRRSRYEFRARVHKVGRLGTRSRARGPAPRRISLPRGRASRQLVDEEDLRRALVAGEVVVGVVDERVLVDAWRRARARRTP